MNEENFNLIYTVNGNPEVCEKILRALPSWFGIEESTQAYIQDSKEIPMLTAYKNGNPIGFISIKEHSQYSCEIYGMGVLPDYHRSGLGRLLLEETQRILKDQDFEFLQVKTVDSSREDEFYKKTRLFYKSLGFRELEVFPKLWSEYNPCLLLVKSIRSV